MGNGKKTFTVSEINQIIKDNLENNSSLSNIWVEGEITNLKYYQLGKQIYFNLSDGHSQINCVVFNNTQNRINFRLENGLSVIVLGKVQYYRKRGSISFQAFYILPKGEGFLSKQFELLKAKLLKEGLFETTRKKTIPKYPANVGLITALDSAAMWDYITISQQIAPNIKIFTLPAIMQGDRCPDSVIKALDIAEKHKQLDLVILLRGGGSAEDLAPFNDEQLVRKIAACQIPVITAIGHEIDYTLADFAADMRAPTPTAAAHKISEGYAQLQQTITEKISLSYERILRQYSDLSEDYLNLMLNLEESINEKFKNINFNLNNLYHRLEIANPLHKLKQGYSICRKSDTNKIVKKTSMVKENDTILTVLKDGIIKSTINDIKTSNLDNCNDAL